MQEFIHRKPRRRGSVLILVIVLVVLLALMGTAMLSTTRTDRYVSTQNVANTNIALLEEGVKEIVKSVITNDVWGRFDNTNLPQFYGYRTPDDSWAFNTGTFSYEHFDAPLMIDLDPAYNPVFSKPEHQADWNARYRMLGNSNDIWLSPRQPSLYLSTVSGIPEQVVAWPALGRLPGVMQFDSPFSITESGVPGHQGAPNTLLPLSYTHRVSAKVGASSTLFRFVPNYVRLLRPDGTGEVFPAWYMPPSGTVTTGYYVLAGDADGDGIADSGMVKIGEFEGVTYYYCTRIIDNNSAINVNTAWSQTADFDFTGGPVDGLGNALTGTFTTQGAGNLGIFRSHVGLREVLFPQNASLTAELQGLRSYRFSHVGAAASWPANTPYKNSGVATGFTFGSVGELLEHQFARRLDNPGTTSFLTAMKRYGLTDSTALAYHGALFNSMDVSVSPLETTFKDAVTGSFDSIYDGTAANMVPPTWANPDPNARRRRSYPISSGSKAIERWYDDNFNYLGLAGSMTIAPVFGDTNGRFAIDVLTDPFTSGARWRSPRSLFTTDSPVTNLVPARYVNPTLTPKVLPVGPSGGPPPIVAGMAEYRPNSTHPNGAPTKTNINTAPFEELWRAFWSVMSENSTTGTPFITAPNYSTGAYQGMQFNFDPASKLVATPGDINPQRMFRSVVRDTRTATPVYFDTREMALYRSAAAATQTIQMRDLGPTKQYYQDISLPLAGHNPVTVRLWGATPQPFLTEFFVWTGLKIPQNAVGDPGNITTNSQPYVAIELYNPYSTDIVLDAQWLILYRNRTGATYPTPAPTLNKLIDFGANTKTIKAGGYLVIDNGMAPPPIISVRNPIITGPLTERLTVPNLHLILDNEMMIVHENVANAFNNNQYQELRPIDSYDSTGMGIYSSAAAPNQVWHYARPCGDERRWQCVYPGRYVGNKPATGAAGTDVYRHQGTDWTTIHAKDYGDETDPTVPDVDDWFEGNSSQVRNEANWPSLGGPNPGGTMPAAIAIQLNNMDFPGPNPVVVGTNKYPFGGFMRNGDILAVPFVAACTIFDPVNSNALIDMNSVSMDAAFAEDSDPDDDFARVAPGDSVSFEPDKTWQREQVGRFCPLRIIQPGNLGDPGDDIVPIDDFNDGGTYTIPPPAVSNPKWHYRWATDLFDYLTVQSASSDYLANVAPVTYSPPPAVPIVSTLAPEPVDNDGDGAGGEEILPPGAPTPPGYIVGNVGKEDTLPIQGLINLNTAPWKVLAAIPWVPANSVGLFSFKPTGGGEWVFLYDPSSGDTVPDNEDIARAIVYWRDGDASNILAPPGGPFRTIFDLYKVRLPVKPSSTGSIYVFDEIQRGLRDNGGGFASKDLDDDLGDFSPYNMAVPAPIDPLDHSHYDFEEMYQMLIKVSNLITVRSDSFTVYIQLQGWRGVGTNNPQLVIQRRSAFIQDRSSLTETNKTLAPPVNIANE